MCASEGDREKDKHLVTPSSHVPGMCRAIGNPLKGRKWRIYFLSQYSPRSSGKDPDAPSTYFLILACKTEAK